jgi:anti-anti-sigma factor
MTMSIAELELSDLGPVVHAKVDGDIDMSNTQDLRRELSASTPNAAYGLILDLHGVRYLDSAGIQMIHHLREDLKTSGQRLILIIPPDSFVAQTLKLAGLDWRADIAETLDGAREKLVPAADSG